MVVLVVGTSPVLDSLDHGFDSRPDRVFLTTDASLERLAFAFPVFLLFFRGGMTSDVKTVVTDAIVALKNWEYLESLVGSEVALLSSGH